MGPKEIIDSPLSALVAIDLELNSSDHATSADSSRSDQLNRLINFMYYDLASQADGRSDEEAFLSLNQYLFYTKKFHIAAAPVLLSDILQARRGCYSAIALLYIHLGRKLGLKIDFVRWPQRAILKWECQGKSHYVDLEQCGKILSEDDLLASFNQQFEAPQPNRYQVDSLTPHEAVMQYLAYLSGHFLHRGEREKLHMTLGLILSIEPENARFLAERALLRRELGLAKDALHDMKRYFSFTEKMHSNSELVLVYEELLRSTSPTTVPV